MSIDDCPDCAEDCCTKVMGNYLDQRKADHGPQKSPSSVRAVEAQVRQIRNTLTTEGE